MSPSARQRNWARHCPDLGLPWVTGVALVFFLRQSHYVARVTLEPLNLSTLSSAVTGMCHHAHFKCGYSGSGSMAYGHIPTCWGPIIVQGLSGMLCVVVVSPFLAPMALTGRTGFCAVAWAGIYTEISQLSFRGMGPLVSLGQVSLSRAGSAKWNLFHTICVHHATIIRRMAW